jgi:hypothetical protein
MLCLILASRGSILNRVAVLDHAAQAADHTRLASIESAITNRRTHHALIKSSPSAPRLCSPDLTEDAEKEENVVAGAELSLAAP